MPSLHSVRIDPSYPHVPQILIIEDDLDSQSMFAKIIRDIAPSARIDQVASAEMATQKIAKRSSVHPKTPYDLIIADIFLEGAATGLDLWRFCYQEMPRVTLLVTSGLPIDRFYSAIGRDVIAPPFLQKPFQLGEAEQMISSLLKYRMHGPNEFRPLHLRHG